MNSTILDTAPYWKIYDSLIEGIDTDDAILDFAAGLHWFAAKGKSSLGLAMGPAEGMGAVSLAGSVAGRTARELASYAKSWNWPDASMGIAAINSWYNEASRVTRWIEEQELKVTQSNVFDYLLPHVAGKRVTVIGHFGGLQEIASLCDLTILERKPGVGDTPDPACEYVLPYSDFVILTSTTMLNKTLPRLLDLARNAYVALAGPTTTFWPGWFEQGVDLLAGVIVEEPERVLQLVREGGSHTFFGNGARMINVCNPMSVLG